MDNKVKELVERYISEHNSTEIFNIDLATADVKVYSTNPKYNTFPSEMLQKIGLYPCQFHDPLDDISTKIILDYKPVFQVYMGEDSLAQIIGYPKLGKSLYLYSDHHDVEKHSGIHMKLREILIQGKPVGLFVSQFEPCPCTNISFALFPFESIKYAGFFGAKLACLGRDIMECYYNGFFKENPQYKSGYKGGPTGYVSNTSEILLKQYGKEVLNIDFNE